jgi:hypothetical protein
VRWLLPALLLAACGPVDPEVLDDLPGVMVVFDPDADTTDPASFYDRPFPADDRMHDGAIDLRGFPRPDGHVRSAQLIEAWKGAVGWPVVPNVYVQFEGAVRRTHPDDGVAEGAHFLDLETGERIPAVAHALPPDDYVPPGLLGLAPYPGFVLRPDTPHAAVVLRSFGDAGGTELGSPAELREALRAEDGLLAPLAPWLDDPDAVAAATVFTTRDAVAETAALVDEVRAGWQPEVLDLQLEEAHDAYCELRGTITLPQFQRGEPPFDADGLFADGPLTELRTDVVPVTVAVPRQAAPTGGFPVAYYAHGTSGSSREVVDRGPVTEPDGERAEGEGPALVLAERGFVAVGMAQLLVEERLGEAISRPYLNLSNLAAYRDTWRQGILDVSLLLEALTRLTIDAAALEACAVGADPVELRDDAVFLLGQSAGAHLVTEVGAIEPRARALAPTGAGGYWPLLMAGGSRVGGPPEVAAVLLGTQEEISILHPGFALLEGAWEPADPLVYAPRLSVRPLRGEPRDLFLPFGLDDGYFPEPIFDAMAVAYGLDRAGEALWTSMDDSLGLAGRELDLPYPVAGNRDWTGVAVQWDGLGLIDTHGVFMQQPGLRHQWGCFLRTAADGEATVVAPDGACE